MKTKQLAVTLGVAAFTASASATAHTADIRHAPAAPIAQNPSSFAEHRLFQAAAKGFTPVCRGAPSGAAVKPCGARHTSAAGGARINSASPFPSASAAMAEHGAMTVAQVDDDKCERHDLEIHRLHEELEMLELELNLIERGCDDKKACDERLVERLKSKDADEIAVIKKERSVRIERMNEILAYFEEHCVSFLEYLLRYRLHEGHDVHVEGEQNQKPSDDGHQH